MLVSSLAHAWGFDGHRRLASMMQDPLPAGHCLKTWLQTKQTTARQDTACDPDRWRVSTNANYDPMEAPRHYLEIDWVQPTSDYPRNYDEVVQKLGPNNANNNGKVPWRVEEKYAELVAAFRAKDEAKVTALVFVFSHYVTDSFSILHDTKNFDPNGLHARWESDMLQPNANVNGIAQLAPTYFGTLGVADPRNNTFDVVMVGQTLVPQLIAADQASFLPDGGFDMPGFYGRVKDLTARRWGDALTLYSSLLWSAWAEAGAPDLTGFSGTCSRAVPQGEIVLKGYPPPNGFTHTDGGQPSAGGGSGAGGGGGASSSGGGAAGGGGGSGSGGGSASSAGGGGEAPAGGGVAMQEGPSGCQTAPALGVLALAALVLFRKRRA